MIGFLHPWVLGGLTAAAIPVLLHLLARREPPTVTFPAVRYLLTTTHAHQRRLKLQHWLLLLVRTALLAILVLAAAGPTVPFGGAAGHGPGALALILDNSASSGAIVGGLPRLRQLQVAAREVLSHATPGDALWLMTADRVPRRGDVATLGALVDSVTVSPRRLDLGAAITLADQVLLGADRPGGIVLISDMQASALSAAKVRKPLVVTRPAGAPAPNVGVADIGLGPQPWSSDGGRVTVRLSGDSGAAVAVSARLDERPSRQALARPGGGATLTLPGVPAGWWTVRAEVAPDEFRLDDEYRAAVRVAPVATVTWDSASRFIAAACEVLEANHRIRRGPGLTIGALGPHTSVVTPPDDPAAVGALNRALAARGSEWRFGALADEPVATDSGPLVGRVRVLRRYALEPTASGRTGVLATAGGTPWLVRSGDILILGSRLDPGWTDFPARTGFMLFMDALLNRLARGEVVLAAGAPGDPVTLPDRVTEVRRDNQKWTVEGGGQFRPVDRGIYYLVATADTIGAVSSNLDQRESLLVPATDRQIRELWAGARPVDLADVGNYAFAAGSRGDLRGPLLWAALLLGLTEVGLASGWRRAR